MITERLRPHASAVRVGCALAAIAAAALISFRATYEPDLWWHMAHGREVAGGHFVRTNLFSFTHPDYRQLYTAWLFDFGSYMLWTRVGPAALQAVQTLLIASTLLAIAAACLVRSSAAATTAACIFGWLIIEPRALPRPHVVSFLGLALCVWMIERARQRGSARPLWWAPLLIAIWANLHVECVFGVALVGIFGAAEWLRPASLRRREAGIVVCISAVSLLATAANPYGFGLLRYLYENAFVPQVVNIAELLPPYLPPYRAFFAWLIGGALVVMIQWRSVTLADVLMLAPFLYLACAHLRMTPLFFIVSAPVVARAIDDLQRFGIDRRAVAATAAAASILLARVPVPAMMRELGVGRPALTPPEFFSEPAMQFARDHHLSGAAFTSMNLGGFVAWELYPSVRTFVDSRLQAYPPEHFRTIIEASKDAEAWAAITAGVDFAVLSLPRVNELSGVGKFREPDWHAAYEDQSTQIVVRSAGRFGKLVQKR